AVAPVDGADKSAWRRFAEEGDYDHAYQALAASRLRLRDEPGELLLAADVARLSHHPAEAVTPLQRVLHDHARDPRAPLAAFTLRRVLREELARPREAGAAFAEVRAVAPQGARGPLSDDALAREVEAWSRAGERERARARAADYVRESPAGRRLRAVHRL